MEIVGRKIVAVRPMTESEIEITWGSSVYHGGRAQDCIELDNGDIIIPSADYEGNCAGVFFGTDHDKSYVITSPDEE